MTTRAILGVWTLALACAAAAIVLIAASDHTSGKLATALLAIPALLAFVASGILARSQRPHNRTGLLLMLVGFAWSFGALSTANNAYVFTAGLVLGVVFTALLAHLLLAFPTGRLSGRVDRTIAVAFYAVVAIGPLLAYLFDEGDLVICDGTCPDNVLSIFPNQTVANAIALTYALVAVALAAAVLVRLVQRWRGASPALRRALLPVLVASAVLITLAIVQTFVGFFSEDAARAFNWLVLAAVLLLPLSFLYGLTRSRFGATTRRLVAELSEKRRPEEVQDVLRAALRDPTLELGYLATTHGGYVDVEGRPLALPGEGEDRTTTQIGEEILIHDAALRDQPELNEVVDAAHIALERGLSLRSLEASERRNRALLDALPDSMYRISADGTFLDFNVNNPARLPAPADQIIGRNIRELLPLDVAATVLDATRRALENDTVEVVNYSLDRPEIDFEEPRRQLEARIVVSGPDEALAIVRDVTAMKKSEDALRELAEAQGALRRVATLAAEVGDRERERLFRSVTEEAARLLGAQSANTVRFADDGAATAVGGWAGPGIELIEAGTDVPMDSDTPLVHVARTGEPARIESYEGLPGQLAAMLRRVGWRSGVSAPIFVSGRLWGAISAGRTVEEPFPEGAERRIAEFGEIVGIALANAEAREQLSGLAEEQAALSRVAVAVATASRPEVLFDTVTEEVARLLGADAANLVRFDESGENAGVIVGKWSEPGVPIPGAGTPVDIIGGALARVRDTGRPARGSVDDPDNPPALVARLNELGVTSFVAAPIEVLGRLWGAVVVSVTGDQSFADDAEERIGQFASLVAVALANAEAREQLSSLAEEQAALSRVAVAVATASEPAVLFNVVTEEVARRLGSDAANLIRFDAQNELEGIVVGRWSSFEADIASVGTRVELSGGPVTRVRRTGRPARGHIDDPDITPSPLVDQLRERGVRSMVAAPIEVSGELWGAVVVTIAGDRAFAADAEQRIAQFAGLVAVALANAEARKQLSSLAEEQAALSRVAVGVATEAEPEHLFSAVSEEVGRLLGARSAATVRYVSDKDESVIVGGWGADERYVVDVGARLPFQGGAIERVARTGQPARVDVENEEPSIRRMMKSTDVSSQVAAPIVVSGQLWGATSVSIGPPDRFPPDAEERLGKFTGLVALALANAEAREQLTASRARIVQEGDAARRRFERNLHDGAQQRLVTLSLTLRLAQARLDDDPAAAQELLEASSAELAAALEELRELARGLHPAILSDRGLGAALEALATRAPVPVALDHVPPGRLPPPVEAAAYYVVAESLTNVAKYAEASSAHVSVVQHDGFAVVEVEDDGVGGVDITRGSGLRGLADRVEALEGRLTVSSEVGRGTRVRAEIPCSPEF